MDLALELVASLNEKWWMAELLRLRGECLQGAGEAVSEVGRHFVKARDIATRQGAKSWALRAACSFARLHYETDRQTEALDSLNSLLHGFAEGATMPDQLEASRLAEQLGASFARPRL